MVIVLSLFVVFGKSQHAFLKRVLITADNTLQHDRFGVQAGVGKPPKMSNATVWKILESCVSSEIAEIIKILFEDFSPVKNNLRNNSLQTDSMFKQELNRKKCELYFRVGNSWFFFYFLGLMLI